jgi:transposase
MIIHLYLKDNHRKCPKCSSTQVYKKDTIVKKLYHPYSNDRKCFIYFYHFKFKCNNCNSNFLQKNNIVYSGKCITLPGELNILHKLKNYKTTSQDVSDFYHIPKMDVINCFDNHVNINRHNLTKVICVDEFHSKNLTETKYCFAIYDPLNKTVLDVVDSRRKEALEEYFSHISKKERENVYFVNIDMWQTYKEIAEMYLPNATVCVDSFHVIKHLNKALDDIRKKIQRNFKNDKNDSRKQSWYWLLFTFKYFLLADMDNIKYKRHPNSHFSHLWTKWDVLEALLSTSDGLREAYNLKEEYREFNKTATYEEALEKLPIFIKKFKKNRYAEFREFGKMLERWFAEIINSFIVVDGLRMSNGPMESLNSRIRRIIDNGFGFSRFQRFKNKVMYSLNKDEPVKF